MPNYLDELHSILLQQKNCEDWDSGLNGRSAVALFFFYHYKLTNKIDSYNRGIELIEYELNNLKNISSVSLFNGISGIAWSINHLCDENLLDFVHDEILPNLFEKSLKKIFFSKDLILSNQHFETNCDILFYFVERFSSTKSKKFKEKYKIFINQSLIFFTHSFYQLKENNYYENISVKILESFIKILNLLKNLFSSPLIDFLLSESIKWIIKNPLIQSNSSIYRHVNISLTYIKDEKFIKKVNIFLNKKSTENISLCNSKEIGIWNSGYSKVGLKLITEQEDCIKDTLQYLLY
ncbi:MULTISPECIES: lanthionine synthetase LanC family protein [Chryseobacterium]|uniref:Lanthionine synthetase C-like protein n=1 Tax=Candidatus Chryseobacterium massiliense TaxID=204089 RepID=A0A3D9BE28_9FLAO|nr:MULTISPECIES: lanthionine synthetase LanC family protein [Chryseobacterium]REC51682.1 hypothetical protein DRF68_05195 [Candidatus Chryseobacterium massiliae]